MSRLRSQLEKLRHEAETGPSHSTARPGSNPIDAVERQLQRRQIASDNQRPVGHNPEPPRRSAASAQADGNYRRDERQFRPAPAQRPVTQHMPGNSGQDIGRIREGIDALAEKLAGLSATRQAPQRSEIPVVTPDQIDSLGRELRSEFARMRDDLDNRIQTVGHSLSEAINQSAIDMRPDPRRDEMLAEELQRIADGIARLQNNPAGEPVYLDEIAAELHQMREEIAVVASHGSPQIDLGGVARSIESGYADIAARLEETVTTAIRNGADSGHDQETINHIIMLSDHVTAIRDRMESMSLGAIQQHVEELSDVVNALSGTGNQSLTFNFNMINDRLDEITRALVAVSINPPGGLDALDRIEARMTSLSKAIDKVAEDNAAAANSFPVELLENGLSELSRKFDLLSEQAFQSGSTTAEQDALASRLEEIAIRLDAMAAGPGQEPVAPAIDGIFQGLEALSSKLDRLAETGLQSADIDASGILASRLDEIVDHLAHMAVENTARTNLSAASAEADSEDRPNTANFEAVLSVIESQLTAIFDRLPEPGSVSHNAAGSDNSEIMSMLSVLSDRIEKVAGSSHAALPDSEQLAALEHQLAGIASHLTTIGANGFDLEPLNQRLENIELQIANSRDIAMDAAAEAAERAARMVASSSATSGDFAEDSDYVSQLAADLRNLEESTRHLGEMHAQSFESVRDTMTMISERLGDIEQHLQSASQASHYPAQSRYGGMNAGDGYDDQRGYGASRQQAHENEYASGDYGSGADSGSAYAPAMSMAAGHATSHSRDDLLDDYPVESRQSSFESNEDTRYSRAGHGKDLPPLDDAPSLHMEDLPEMADGGINASDALGNRHGYNDLPDDAGQINSDQSLPDDDVPLEPGSGVPDLEALMRQATARRRGGQATTASPTATSDLIAQKRREAQAAAQAAAQMAAAAGAQESQPQEKPARAGLKLPGIGGLGAIGSVLAGRKKLLMGGAAILLLAVMAGPIISMVTGSGEPATVEVAQSDASSQSAAEPVDAQTEASGEVQANAGSPADAGTQSGDPLVTDAETPATDASATDTGNSASMAGSDTVSVPAVPEEVGNEVLRQAAEAGDPQALFEVARRYTDGDLVEQNLDTARQWYEISARAGFAPAQYRLANFLEKGHGGTQDLEKAAMWYQRAAEQGNALAMHNLAVLYAGGLLSSGQDMEAATQWFAKAGELGVKDSQVNLGILYTRGKGVEENLVEAYKWFAIAASGGDADAAQKRDTLAGSMRPDQLQTARGLVELWKPAELNADANSVTPNPAWTSIPGLSAETPPEQLSPKEMVRRSQEMLAKLGFDPGPADGLMGAKTRDAIRQFQKQKGLPVDGEVTAELLEKLVGQSA